VRDILEKMSLGFISEAVSGALAGPEGAQELTVTGVSSDTRSIAPGSLFIALRGENFDGSDFLEDAFAKGAAACLGTRPSAAGPVVVVPDTGRALISLAAAYRSLFDIPSVGVTGSVGKTSTKDMIWCALSEKFRTLKNEGNRNNTVGMPLSVFGLGREHQAAVLEMGMSGFGEIAAMTGVAQPQVAVITNIGVSHIEKLGTRENILKAKLEILKGLRPGGCLVLNGDDPMLRDVKPAGIKTYYYGTDPRRCGITAENIRDSGEAVDFDICGGLGQAHVSLPLAGRHNVYNALAAFCCAALLGVESEAAARGIEKFRPFGLRQRMEHVHGVTLIEDCYNASPDSMASAFAVLAGTDAVRRIAVLADMLELGEASKDAHIGVGRAARRAGADILLAYGPQAKYYCEGFGEGRECRHFDSKDELARAVAETALPGDAVLFKGSRGMKLEDAIKSVCERWKTN
jgi:UDP-N-acetylmuramoyl-tripeptide--D-alanyl-D-alanine ligase